MEVSHSTNRLAFGGLSPSSSLPLSYCVVYFHSHIIGFFLKNLPGCLTHKYIWKGYTYTCLAWVQWSVQTHGTKCTALAIKLQMKCPHLVSLWLIALHLLTECKSTSNYSYHSSVSLRPYCHKRALLQSALAYSACYDRLIANRAT